MYRHSTKLFLGAVASAAVAVASLLIAGSPALAHGGDTSIIHACVDSEEDGETFIVGPNDLCDPEDEVAVHWSITGPQGPTGPSGPSGPAGPSAADLCTGQSVLLADGSCVDLLALIEALEARQPRTVFVTSQSSNANLGGVAGADALCQAAADSGASIVPNGTYLAWISDGTGNSPSVNFTQSARPYELPDGTPVATDWGDLTDGAILNPINVDETGTIVVSDTSAWTNTWVHGGVFNTANHCNNWAAPLPPLPAIATMGGIWRTGREWTWLGTSLCGGEPEHIRNRRLYCFQQ